MPKLVVLYPRPSDAAQFESAMLQEHLPLVRAQMPGAALSMGRVIGGAAGASPWYWVSELHFDTLDALRSAASSAGGQRAAGHAQQISTGGAPVFIIVEDVA